MTESWVTLTLAWAIGDFNFKNKKKTHNYRNLPPNIWWSLVPKFKGLFIGGRSGEAMSYSGLQMADNDDDNFKIVLSTNLENSDICRLACALIGYGKNLK